jgi:hypothetical protein
MSVSRNFIAEVKSKYNVRAVNSKNSIGHTIINHLVFSKNGIDACFTISDIADISYGLCIGKEAISTDKIYIIIDIDTDFNKFVNLKSRDYTSPSKGFGVEKITLPYNEFVTIIKMMGAITLSTHNVELCPKLVATVSNCFDHEIEDHKIVLKYYHNAGNIGGRNFCVATFSKGGRKIMKFILFRTMFNSDYTSLADDYDDETGHMFIKLEHGKYNIIKYREDDDSRHTALKLSKNDVDSLIRLYDELLVKVGHKSILPPKPIVVEPEVVKDVEINLIEGNNDNVSDTRDTCVTSAVSKSVKYEKLIKYFINEAVAAAGYDTKTAFSLFVETVDQEEYRDLLEILLDKIVSSK